MCIEYDIEEPVFYLPVDYWNNSNNNGMKFLSNSHLLLLVCCCFAATFRHIHTRILFDFRFASACILCSFIFDTWRNLGPWFNGKLMRDGPNSNRLRNTLISKPSTASIENAPDYICSFISFFSHHNLSRMWHCIGPNKIDSVIFIFHARRI